MKKFALIALTAMTLLSACNTISGMGKDVSAAGNAVSGSAESVKITNPKSNFTQESIH